MREGKCACAKQSNHCYLQYQRSKLDDACIRILILIEFEGHLLRSYDLFNNPISQLESKALLRIEAYLLLQLADARKELVRKRFLHGDALPRVQMQHTL
jgi:hypothetical protein